MGRIGKTVVAGFDALVMAGLAFVQTGGRFALAPAELVLWGSAVAAAICALIVYAAGSAVVAWLAIGYVLFGALLTSGSPHWPLLALSAALMPLVPRPRGSVVLGLAIAVIAAVGTRYAIASVL